MRKDYNLYELTELIKRLCNAHPLVNDFMTSVYRLNDTDDVNYPAIALTINSATPQQNTIDFNINLLYADRLTDNRDNDISIQSTGIGILLEMLNVIEENANVVIPTGNQILPFMEQFADNTAGVFTSVTLTVPNYIGDCYWLDPDCLDC